MVGTAHPAAVIATSGPGVLLAGDVVLISLLPVVHQACLMATQKSAVMIVMLMMEAVLSLIILTGRMRWRRHWLRQRLEQQLAMALARSIRAESWR